MQENFMYRCDFHVVVGMKHFFFVCEVRRIEMQETTLEVTHGQILSQSPTDATRLWLHLYES